MHQYNNTASERNAAVGQARQRRPSGCIVGRNARPHVAWLSLKQINQLEAITASSTEPARHAIVAGLLRSSASLHLLTVGCCIGSACLQLLLHCSYYKIHPFLLDFVSPTARP